VEADLAKPSIAIANSYTQFVPGHVHLKPLGDRVAQEIYRAGECNVGAQIRLACVCRWHGHSQTRPRTFVFESRDPYSMRVYSNSPNHLAKTQPGSNTGSDPVGATIISGRTLPS